MIVRASAADEVVKHATCIWGVDGPSYACASVLTPKSSHRLLHCFGRVTGQDVYGYYDLAIDRFASLDTKLDNVHRQSLCERTWHMRGHRLRLAQAYRPESTGVNVRSYFPIFEGNCFAMPLVSVSANIRMCSCPSS